MTYCYVCEECGARSVETRPVSEATFRPLCKCGVKMDRDFSAEIPGGHLSQCWPMWSDTGGCHPEQIGEWKKALAKEGVSAEFRERDGAIKWESSAHRKRCCEALGMFDRNGSYGDPRKR